MGEVEDTGRETLAEMRRILGVLRHSHDRAGREPRPGVEQIYALIQQARDRGQRIDLGVDGEPGTLPTGVDLAVYRVLEEALGSAREQPQASIAVALRFNQEDVELQLAAECRAPNAWPTEAMRERIALCGGQLHAEVGDGRGWQVVARLPRGFQGALA